MTTQYEVLKNRRDQLQRMMDMAMTVYLRSGADLSKAAAAEQLLNLYNAQLVDVDNLLLKITSP